MNRVKNQAGFTLIELVVVIVILGILAATAAPRFINLQDDATEATLDAVLASMQTANSLVRAKSLIEGNQDSDAGNTVNVNVDGTDVPIRFGFPRSNNAAAATIWSNNLLDVANDFTVEFANGGIVVRPSNRTFTGSFPTDLDNPTSATRNCYVFYQEPTAVNGAPQNLQVVPCR